MPVAFDDLIPATGEKKSLSFDDLIPSDSGQGAAFQAAEEQQAMERGELQAQPPANPIPYLEKPLFQFPHRPVTSEQPLPARVGNAVLNKAGDFVSGLTGVEGLLGLVPPIGVAQIIAQAPDLVDKVKKASETPAGSPERIDAGLDVVAAVGSLGAMGGAMKFGLKKGARAGEVPKPKPDLGIKEAPSEPVGVNGQNELPKPSLSGESLAREPQEMIREGPPSAEDARGLPVSKPVTQRFVQPEGAPVLPESQTTAGITRDALAWRKELMNEGQRLGIQAQIMSDAGMRVPKPLSDRINEINAELAKGFQPEQQPKYELRGEAPLEEELPQREAPSIPEPSTGEPNAVPIRSTETQIPPSIERRQDKPISREGVRPSEQGEEIAGAGQAPEESQTELINRVFPKANEDTSRVGIAHKYGEERFPDQIERGEGTTVEAQVERGRELLRRGTDPGQIVRRVEKTGRVSGDDMSVLRAQLETFQHAADTAAEASRTNPGDPVLKRAAEQAMQNELAWRKTIKPAATAFHEIGMTLQGQAEVNYGTLEGLRRSAFDLHGKDVNPAQAATLKEVATRVRRETQLATESLQRATTQIENTLGRKKPARSVEQLRNDLANRLKELTPC